MDVGKKQAARKGLTKQGAGPGAPRPLPKKKCCASAQACARCPLQMLREGTLPSGYTVKHRRLVKLETPGLVTLDKKALRKAAKKVARGKKLDLALDPRTEKKLEKRVERLACAATKKKLKKAKSAKRSRKAA